MVKVAKIAVWDVEGELIRDSKTATKAARLSIIRELLRETAPRQDEVLSEDQFALWVGQHWETIEARTEKAMTGT